MSLSLRDRLALMDPLEREALLTELGLPLEPHERERQMRIFLEDWRALARPEQLPPSGTDWSTWIYMGGRGSGKTRAASEATVSRLEDHYLAHEAAPDTAPPLAHNRAALAGRAAADVRAVIVEGISGIIAISERRGHRVIYEPSKHLITWPDLGAEALTFTAEEPEQGRGPEFHTAWCDEVGSWDQNKTDPMGNSLFTNLELALRLTAYPRMFVTTTPRQIALMRQLVKDARDPDNPRVVMSTGSTASNRANLSPAFIEKIYAKYAGTRLARQELMGQLLDDVEGALWTTQMIIAAEQQALTHLADLDALDLRRVVAVDPPITANTQSDECGIIVASLLPPGTLPDAHPATRGRHQALIREDASLQGATPEQWGAAAVAAARRHGASTIVAEANQGGEMVRSVIENAGAALHGIQVILVKATKGKQLRAEPVAQLYEQNRVAHLEAFDDLSDQMTSWTPLDKYSPDRLDALVWALTHLSPWLQTSPGRIHAPASAAAAAPAGPAGPRQASPLWTPQMGIRRSYGPKDAPLVTQGNRTF